MLLRLRLNLTSAAVACGLVAFGAPCAASASPSPSLPCLHPGAIEIGVAGSATSAAGVTQGEIGLRAGRFFALRRALLEATLEPSYSHVEGLDLLDVEGSLSWEHGVRGCPAYGFVAAAVGVRQEWIGSFREARYPVGLGVGARLLAGSIAGVRVEYRYRRVLHDPIADLSEHHLLLGLSLFFHNRPPLPNHPQE